MSCDKIPTTFSRTNTCKIGHTDPREFDAVVSKLREFFRGRKEFTECHGQSRLSILSACEQPENIAEFNYVGKPYCLPQTTQLQLEFELLDDPTHKGLFSVCTSYRQEPNPTPGRHNLIFPLFDFEMHGDMEDLLQFERELCEFLGYGPADSFKRFTYDEVCKMYDVKDGILDHDHEQRLCDDHGAVVFITDFPNRSDPFWNMMQHDNGTHAKKIDVIMSGMETIGSAQRSSDPAQMREMFDTIADGGYKQILYDRFSEERTEAEMKDFLSLPFITRSGGGIGITRLISSMKKEGLLKTNSD